MNKAIVNIKQIQGTKKDKNNPKEYLLSSIKESKNNKNKRSYYSFKNNKEAIEFLNK